MRDAMKAMLQEMTDLTQAVQQGQLEIRGNADRFSGGWHELVGGVNNLIEAFISPITMTATSLRQIAQGEIPPEITAKYHGDFDTIKR